MKVAQMFNLRKLVIHRKGGERSIIYVYHNYRKTINGSLQVNLAHLKGCPREWAKKQVVKLYPEAEFWR
jgi:hypothetical protein